MEFTRVLCPSPLCAPSRACLASGREYKNCGVASNKDNDPLTLPTYYQKLRAAGYHVMGCGKIDLHKQTLEWGLDGKRLTEDWGFSDAIDNAGKMDAVRAGEHKPTDPYMAMLHRRGLAAAHIRDMRGRKGYAATYPTPLPDDAYCDNWIAANALTLLERAPRNKPWHLVVNFTGPHNPMDITSAMEKRARGRDFPQPRHNTEHEPKTHVAIRQNYAAMCENIDRLAGELLAEIERRGELDNTLVVFSSDHGEMLGDHNRWAKHVPYQPSAGIPLIVAGLDTRKGERTAAMTSLIDVGATFLDYAGAGALPGMEARSLRGVLRGKERKQREVLHSALEEWRLVWDGENKLVEGFHGADALYNLKADPAESENRLTSEKTLAGRLRRALI
jgi:arylsulfatase A-like enzyme